MLLPFFWLGMAKANMSLKRNEMPTQDAKVRAHNFNEVALGYTKEQVLSMTFAEQVRKLVEPYFKPYYKRTKTLNDMYMAILMPKYIGTPDNTVIFSEGKPYNQNKALDKNKDGRITKAEACQYVNHLYLKGQRDI